MSLDWVEQLARRPRANITATNWVVEVNLRRPRTFKPAKGQVGHFLHMSRERGRHLTFPGDDLMGRGIEERGRQLTFLPYDLMWRGGGGVIM